ACGCGTWPNGSRSRCCPPPATRTTTSPLAPTATGWPPPEGSRSSCGSSPHDPADDATPQGRRPCRSPSRQVVTRINEHAACTSPPLIVRFWQPAPGAGAYIAFVLVELRGFEPLTSAMRTQGTH